MIDAVDVKVMDSNEYAHNEMDKIINIIPLSRTFIDESHFSTPVKEIVVGELIFRRR